MNSIAIGVNRLSDLIDLASSAKSAFEKAAIFSATTTLIEVLESELDGQGVDVETDLEGIRMGICGCIEYDTPRGGTSEASAHLAMQSMVILRRRLGM